MKKKRQSHSQQLQPIHVIRAIVLGVAVLIIIGLGTLLVTFFSVKEVSCQLQNGDPCPIELSQQLQILNGKPMFFSNYHQALATDAQISQPYSLKEYSKQLPSTVHLTFVKEQPLIFLKQAGSNHLISDTGKAFPQTDDSTAPAGILVVETDHPLIAENALDLTVLDVIKQIIAAIEVNSLPIETITWVDNSTIRLSMKDRTEVAIIDSESPALELQRLSIVLQSKEYQDLSESKRELDLRFTMPVLRTEP